MNQLVCADNLDVLRQLPDHAVDLIYIDPPFSTGRRQRGRVGLTYPDATTDPETYLTWLTPRLVEMRRILTKAGSLFVHLDFRVVHYAKVALDRIFGLDRLVNEIVWCYSIGGKSRRSFGRKHDSILWYSRSAHYAFYPDDVRVPRRAGSHMRVERDPLGRPVQVKRDAKSGRVYSYPVHLGKIPEDYWTDIETLNRSDRERTGWPTQKPEALLERIIKATTKPGDLVADFFAGSGTAAAVAHRLGRRYLAVDESEQALQLIRRRLTDVIGPNESAIDGASADRPEAKHSKAHPQLQFEVGTPATTPARHLTLSVSKTG